MGRKLRLARESVIMPGIHGIIIKESLSGASLMSEKCQIEELLIFFETVGQENPRIGAGM